MNLMAPEQDFGERLRAAESATLLLSRGHADRKHALCHDNNPTFVDMYLAVLRRAVEDDPPGCGSREKGLVYLADVVALDKKSSVSANEQLALNESLFKKLSAANVMPKLLKFAQMPFEEVAVATHELFKVLAEQKWGLIAIGSQVC